MILDLTFLIKKHELDITGVIHIGAHHGSEYQEYIKNNISNIVFFEASKKNFDILSQNIKYSDNILLFNKALGSENKNGVLFVETANTGMPNSILKPKIHLEQYKHITFNSTEQIEIVKLDDMPLDFKKYNFINIDVQGYELEVFKGSQNILKNIDYIMTEVNNSELYENNVLIADLDEFLLKFGFNRVETDWAGVTWGDALYIKKEHLC